MPISGPFGLGLTHTDATPLHPLPFSDGDYSLSAFTLTNHLSYLTLTVRLIACLCLIPYHSFQ